MKRVFFYAFGLILFVLQGRAQNLVERSVYTVDNDIPAYVYMQEPSINRHLSRTKAITNDNADFLHNVLNLNTDTKAVLTDTLSDFAGGFHKFYKEYYKGVEVEGTRYGIHLNKNGMIASMNGNFRTITALDVIPKVTEGDALETALNHIGAEEYAWQNEKSESLIKTIKNDLTATHKPKGVIRIYFLNEKPHLVYVFKISATKPYFVKRVYIDAHNGDFVDSEDLLYNENSETGVAYTRYSGKRDIMTTKTDYGYTLHDYSRGGGIVTADYSKGDYFDNDNIWTSAEWNNSSMDNAALDAHWGMEQVYDYFYKKFGWNSYDNKGHQIKSVVNVTSTSLINNAHWHSDYKRMEFGITSNHNPVVTLDIAAHEYSHAITDNKAKLAYKGESGALSEGFSDIWGVCVERYARPDKSDNDIWRLGEDIGESVMIRDIKNLTCKYYGGSGWGDPSNINNDHGYVHTNSGVLTYWFYTLVNGGVCEGNAICGIGFDKAEKICFQALTTRLTSNSKFLDAKLCTIDVAEELFGANSEEVLAVKNAWYSVGVINKNDDGSDPETFIVTKVSGSKLLHEGETATYIIENAPANVKFDLGGLQFISFDGKNLVVKATAKARAYINVNSQNSGTYTTFPLWIGVPIISDVYFNAKDNYLIANTFGGDASVSNYMWSVDGGGYSIYPDKYRPYRSQGTINVSVRATNACGTGPLYSHKIEINNIGHLSISQSDDSRTISILSDAEKRSNDNVSYRLIDAKTGRVASNGGTCVGDKIEFLEESNGLYLLELTQNNDKPISFKVVLK